VQAVEGAISPSLLRSVARVTRRARRCPNGGKVIYRTHKKALKMADRFTALDGERFYAYKCSNCDGFHLTRQAQGRAAV
jgi:predicted RNA-binding Zn-ribbon protein involved in translation (DUF1610 family)